MRRRWAVAGFAAHSRVLALVLRLRYVRMASLTGGFARERTRARHDLRERRAPIMPVLPEALRHDRRADQKERRQSHPQQRDHPRQMSGFLEDSLHPAWGVCMSIANKRALVVWASRCSL